MLVHQGYVPRTLAWGCDEQRALDRVADVDQCSDGVLASRLGSFT